MSFTWRTVLGAGAAVAATGLLTGPFAAPALAAGSTDVAVTIENLGPQKAGSPWGVVVNITSSKPTSTLKVTFTQPSGVNFYEGPYENAGWTCKNTGNTSTCSAYGGKKRTAHEAVFAFVAPKDGAYSFTANVTSAETDTDPANNTASTTVTVGAGAPASSPAEPAPTTAAPSPEPSASANDDELPDTGYEIRNMALAGTAMIALGAVLVRRRRTV